AGRRADEGRDLCGALETLADVLERRGNPEAPPRVVARESIELVDAVERRDRGYDAGTAPRQDDLLDAPPALHHLRSKLLRCFELPSRQEDECTNAEGRAEILRVLDLAGAGQGSLGIRKRGVEIVASQLHQRAHIAVLILLVVR